MPLAVAITRAMSPRGSTPALAVTRKVVARGRSDKLQSLTTIAFTSSTPSMWRKSSIGSVALPRAPPISRMIALAPVEQRWHAMGAPAAVGVSLAEVVTHVRQPPAAPGIFRLQLTAVLLGLP